MNFLDLAAKRYSVRGFDPRPVEREKIMQILEAARLAPSACNNQPCHFIVVQSPAARGRLVAAYNRPWFNSAPAIIAVCIERKACWQRSDGKNYGDVDAAIAMDHIMLCATSLDLGTCWIGAFNEAEAKTALNLPEGIEPICLTPIGYPALSAHKKNRKPLSEIVSWDTFGNKKP